VLRAEDKYRNNLENLNRLTVTSSKGGTVGMEKTRSL
jgi:multidrug efflux pump subunit AcrB